MQKAYHRKILSDTESDGIFNLADDEYDLLPPISERGQSENGTMYRSNSRSSKISFATNGTLKTRDTKTDSLVNHSYKNWR
jgi:hypothetical protein